MLPLACIRNGINRTSAVIQSKEDGHGGVDSMTHLGYPVYVLTILGIWKILGVIALLIPKFPLLKEWAYAGFFFVMSGAIFSHVAVGDPMNELFPSLLLLLLTLVSWYFRPADRKIISVTPFGAVLASKELRETGVLRTSQTNLPTGQAG